MKILDDEDSFTLISNFEVYKVIREHQMARKRIAEEHQKKQQLNPNYRRKAAPVPPQNQVTIEDAVMLYLRHPHYSGNPVMGASFAAVRQFLDKLSEYKLTQTEKLQLLNARPTTLVEVHLIIQNCEERLSEQETVEILDSIEQLLTKPGTQKQQQAEDQGQEQDNGEDEEAAAAAAATTTTTTTTTTTNDHQNGSTKEAATNGENDEEMQQAEEEEERNF